MSVKLTFLGGVGTVTGSKYLLEAEGLKILVDCGLFQGYKQLRLRNWGPLPVDPKSIDAVILTHAHLDHSGYVPLLVRNGFKGPVISTEATRDLCAILLPDSGFLQEKDADFANRHGFSKHHPALPLYTRKDAELSLERFRPVGFGAQKKLFDKVDVRFRGAGHILGASTVELDWNGRKIVFSGDLGRYGDGMMLDPEPVRHADYLLVESTYGNRLHEQEDPEDVLAKVITETAGRGGTIVIPAFAVGRAQLLLFHIQRLKDAGRIPDLPVFLDSPMAVSASEVYRGHLGEHRLTAEECNWSGNAARYVQDVEESKDLDRNRMPKVIVSASGMATGGRVLHHLKHYATDHRNTILFAGYQAGGTRGAALVAGATSVKIHGSQIPVRAQVGSLQMLSAHADADEIMRWLGNFQAPPKLTFVTHGEPDAADALRHRIESDLHWSCHVPDYREEIELA
ncbi:MBL fold metallo-hydrolase RNA specificity domain-containing protein [Roseibium sediminicola]|uniref:MBL fold metallo-hydrolase n=1 Tax=Roseibium sediminicola TaxID=2933272 RepID=A0ABT0GR89_9HYPH|nr:MBL fold metallo-hydrolase [Roseibium sp. CAU 1639]MCK7611801.1 MBL fold metallo-hydrolase [Roseibium sp. CAU 1639]